MAELCDLTAHEVVDLLRRREVSASEVLESVLRRISEVEPMVRAYITVTEEVARRQAAEVDWALSTGEELPPLAGVPIAIKDIICTKGIRTTCASKILENFVPPYDATVTLKVYESKMVLVGKTNLDEFAMGSSTENSAFFPTRNPWDLERVPGGSSGGSAAAVAAGEALISLGTDTGGSIRQPASFCGVVGMKPTYGRVSRYGLVAFASSLDQIGPITKDVRDCALLLQVISGKDPRDSTSVDLPVPDYVAEMEREPKGLKVGVITEFLGEGVDKEVRDLILEAAKVLEGLGMELGEASLPHVEYALPCYYLIAPAEASSNLARYDGVRHGLSARPAKDPFELFCKTRRAGFGPEVKRRIMLGSYALSAGYYDAYYLKAQKVRTLIRRDFERAFEEFDVLLCPTSPTPPFRLGEKISDPLAMYMSDICTIPVNLAGLPAISVPCGFVGGLPVGLQIIGRPFDEPTVLRVAYAYEQSTEWHKARPDLSKILAAAP